MGQTTFLAPEVPLIASSGKTLEKEIEGCIREAEIRIVVGLKNVPYIDSAGLESLCYAQERLQKKGGSLKLVDPNPTCRDILIATRLNDRFCIFIPIDTTRNERRR